MKVSEIFKSIQGETTYAGLPCSFVRLTGCNLRCSYCDTKYAYSGGEDMTLQDVLERVSGLGLRMVTVTGGEPLLQHEVYSLVDRLISGGYMVLVETNGSILVSGLNEAAIKVLDIKCPDSGMCEKMNWGNILHLREGDQVKFVISSIGDYEWAKNITHKYGLQEKSEVLFSPAWGRIKPRELSDWIMVDGLNVRLQPQLHKLIK